MKQKLLTLFLFSVICHAQLPIVNGWTVFTPSADSRIIYVSATGNDGTAQIYNAASVQVGSNPFLPSGAILAYQTLAAAKTQLRPGFPDWILFKKGDTFTNQDFGIIELYGRNINEPMLISSYGPSTSRPVFLTGNNTFLDLNGTSASHVAIVGIEANPHTRTTTSTPTGVFITYSPFTNILIEDCYFKNFHNHIVAQDAVSTGIYTRKSLSVRRCILTDSYNTGTGASGLYIDRVDGILFEENLLDHNGWNSSVAGANPTGFSHNSYFQVKNINLTFKNNIVSRASAVGGGHRCGGIIYDNLYLSNPTNLLIGTYDGSALNWPTQFVSADVSYNVILDSRPESYDQGNGIAAERVTNGNIHHNIVAHFTATSGFNNGIVVNRIQNVTVQNNIVYKWGNNLSSGPNYSSGLYIGGSLLGANSFTNNDIQMENTQGYCVNNGGAFTNRTFGNNRYNNIVSAGNWFANGNFATWQAAASDATSTVTNVPYVDPERNIITYMTSIGNPGNLDTFINQRKTFSKDNWDSNYSANSVNNYIRVGFNQPALGIEDNVVSENKVAFYPNPFTNQINIVGVDLNVNPNVEVYDALGKKVYVAILTSNEIDVSQLKQGLYFVKIGNYSKIMIKN
jgi:hypothetical protein